MSPLCGNFDPFTGSCLTCNNSFLFSLANGSCHYNDPCGPKQIIFNNSCQNVSSKCDTFDTISGNCLTCLNPTSYQLINGTCSLINVTCQPNQYEVNLTCLDIPAECINFDTVKGVCLSCIKGFSQNTAGVCKRVICPNGFVISQTQNECVITSPLC